MSKPSRRVRIGQTKSAFLRGLIRSASFSNAKHRKYVYNLLRLEEYVADGYHCWASAVHYGCLKDQYRYEWEKIYAELKPHEWREQARKGEQTYAMWLDMRKTIEASVQEEEEEAKRRWLAAGGRVRLVRGQAGGIHIRSLRVVLECALGVLLKS